MSNVVSEPGAMDKAVHPPRIGDPGEYVPKTARGRRLAEIRRRIIAEGTPLLSPEQVAEEVKERRGGADA